MTDAAEPFSWHAHPARERSGGAALAAVVILGFSLATWLSTGVVWWAVLSLAVLIIALNRFFFPSRFEIDETGITAQYPLRRQRLVWKELKRFTVDRNGGYLSTRTRRSWLDAYRGMHVLFGAHRDSVVARIRAQLSAGGQPSVA